MPRWRPVVHWRRGLNDRDHEFDSRLIHRMTGRMKPSRASRAEFLRRQWREWRWYAAFVFLVWIPVRSAVADYNPVPSGSMNPTILEGDVVFVNKAAYDLRVPLTLHRVASWADPERGDIVVLLSPADGIRLVKRIIGIPGDTIKLHANRLTINGSELEYTPAVKDYRAIVPTSVRPWGVFAEEDLLGVEHAVMAQPRYANPTRDFAAITVPEGCYFVMGDNRDNSQDSRAFGFVDRRLILGKAESIIASWDIRDDFLPRTERFFTRLR